MKMITVTRPRTRLRRRRLLLGALAFLLALLAGYGVWTNVRPYTLEASIQINATPERVWAVLTDQAAYPGWNPFIVSSAGRIQVGATLTNRMFSGVAVPFYQHWLHTDTLPMFRAMDAALAREAG